MDQLGRLYHLWGKIYPDQPTDKLDNFLEKHTSELVEYWPAESIWEQIEDLAHSVKRNYKS